MKKAAFAFVAVLAVIALSATNLLSQPAREFRQVERRERDITQEVREVSSEQLAAELRDEYLSLAELKAKSMSVAELQQAVQEMQWLKAEAELAPIIEQLRAVAERHPKMVTGHKAEMAVQLLQTRNGRTLNEVNRVLEEERTIPTPTSAFPSSGGN